MPKIPPDPEGMNDDRALLADAALCAFADASGCDVIEEAPGDLLCDLMHWCDRQEGKDLEFAFSTILARAVGHYDAETRSD